MTTDTFNRILNGQLDRCKSVLCAKACEYATTDRLHNFKVAAGLQDITPEQALGGMMAKHTVSVYDMIRDGKQHDLELWDEKITDSINYLLLLRALVEERQDVPGDKPTTFDLEAFTSGKAGVHCSTREAAEAFLVECEEAGLLWNGGEKPTEFDSWKHWVLGGDGIYFIYQQGILHGNIQTHSEIIDYTLCHEKDPQP